VELVLFIILYLSQPREVWGFRSFYKFTFVTTKRDLGNPIFLLFYICHNQERSGESDLFIILYLSQPREIWGISPFYNSIFVTTKRDLGNPIYLLFYICHNQERSGKSVLFIIPYLSQPREIWGIRSFYCFIFVTSKRILGDQFFL